MTLNQLKYAIIVAESESFNEAAKKLFISQPSLSTSIHSLEEEIGVQIFRRSQNGIAVTPEGKEFIGYARQVMEQYELLDARYITKSEVKKRFSVSMQHYSFAVEAFVELLKQYGGEEYDFRIRETQTYELIEDVAKLRSEVGVLYLNSFNEAVLRKTMRENDLKFHRLFIAKPHVFVSTFSPLAKKKIVSTLESKKDIMVSDRATLFNLLIGLNGYTICSGVINEELNGKNIVAVPLAVDDYMEIGYITHSKVGPGKFGTLYIEALKRYASAQE